MAFAVFLTFRLYRPFSAKTLLSEIPSPRSLLSLLHTCITRRPKTDLSAPLYRAFTVFFYFSLVSSVFCKDLLVRIFVSKIFTVFAPCLHHPSALTRPAREPVSTPRRFSCRSLATSLFSVAFALFSVFSLQVLFLFDLTLFFFSRLVLFPLRHCPCSSCLFS